MENINIAELLKNCPKGMELDCTMYDDVSLVSVIDEENIFPIRVTLINGDYISLTKYGQYRNKSFSKCVIFPKGKTTWEGFVPPRFKINDIIQDVDNYKVKITEIDTENSYYVYESVIAKVIGSINFREQDNWKLAPNKFDISTLVPFESKVLVRDDNKQKWKANFWGFYNNSLPMNFPFSCCGTEYAQCIPYNDDTKHLLGTTDDCDEFYKTWK